MADACRIHSTDRSVRERFLSAAPRVGGGGGSKNLLCRGNCAPLAFFALLATPIAAFPQLPTPAEPRVEPPAVPTLPGQPAPEVTVAPLAGEAPPGSDKIFVDFQGVEVEGATVYSPDELKELYAGLVGTRVSLAQVFEVAKQLQNRYRDDGYMLTRVVVPPQKVNDGIFRFKIVEGFVDRVRVDGDIGPVRERVQAYLDKVAGLQPANMQDLERYLLLSNDLPGVTARGVLRPGTGEQGASELVVRLERKPFDGLAAINNRGSKFTGPWRAIFLGAENSMLSVGERTELLFSVTADTDEQKFGRLSYQQQVGSEGLTMGAVGSYGPSEPGEELRDLDVKTKSLLLGTSARYPLIRSRRQNLYLDGGFQAIDTKVKILGSVDNGGSRDRLRVLYAGASYDAIDASDGFWQASAGLRQGLSAFGASSNGDSNLSRPQGKVDFTSIQWAVSRSQGLSQHFGYLLAAKGQYAFNKLLSDEEFSVGGERFGRGYDPSELAGEKGVAVSGELQYNRNTSIKAIPSYQVYGFYDLGAVWNDDTGAERRNSLASTGAGVRTRILRNFFADLEVAKPLTREVGSRGNKSARVFFSLVARF